MSALSDMAVNAARSEVMAGYARVLTLFTPPLFTAIMVAMVAMVSIMWGNSNDITRLATKLEGVAQESAETKKGLTDFAQDINEARKDNRKRWDEIYKEVSESSVRIDALDKGLDEVKAAVKDSSRDINSRLDTLIGQKERQP